MIHIVCTRSLESLCRQLESTTALKEAVQSSNRAVVYRPLTRPLWIFAMDS